MTRKHIYFSGIVQGVGFRFRCRVIAQDFALTGWAKNLRDGRVECEVQGLDTNIARFVQKIQQEPFIEIDRVEMTTIPEIPGEKGFKASYY